MAQTKANDALSDIFDSALEFFESKDDKNVLPVLPEDTVDLIVTNVRKVVDFVYDVRESKVVEEVESPQLVESVLEVPKKEVLSKKSSSRTGNVVHDRRLNRIANNKSVREEKRSNVLRKDKTQNIEKVTRSGRVRVKKVKRTQEEKDLKLLKKKESKSRNEEPFRKEGQTVTEALNWRKVNSLAGKKLEFTPSGLLRAPDDVLGILESKSKSRAGVQKKLNVIHRRKTKTKTLLKKCRRNGVPPPEENIKVLTDSAKYKDNRKAAKKQLVDVKKRQEVKRLQADFRKMKSLQKQNKKDRKKQNRIRRAADTHSEKKEDCCVVRTEAGAYDSDSDGSVLEFDVEDSISEASFVKWCDENSLNPVDFDIVLDGRRNTYVYTFLGMELEELREVFDRVKNDFKSSTTDFVVKVRQHGDVAIAFLEKYRAPVHYHLETPSSWVPKVLRDSYPVKLVQNGIGKVSGTIDDFSFGVPYLDIIYVQFHSKIKEYKELINTILYLHQMSISHCYTMDVSLTASFWLNTVNIKSAGTYTGMAVLYRLFKKRHVVRKRRVSGIKTEALSDYTKKLSDVSKEFLESDIVGALRNIVLVALSYSVFNVDVSKQIGKYFVKPEKRLSVPDAIVSILNSFTTLLQMGEAIAGGMHWTDAFRTRDPLGTTLVQARNLLLYENMLYYGLPHAERKEAKTFMQELIPLLGNLEKSVVKMNPLTSRYEEVSKTILSLKRAQVNVNAKLSKDTRIAPIAILVHGPPGIGKSSVMNFIYQLHAHVKNRKFDSSQVYHRVATSQYWDGYDPYSTPYVHFSEVGSLSSALAAKAGDPLVAELTSLVDVEPHQVDMAFEGKNGAFGKGNTFCMCELLVGDTNNVEMNLDKIVSNPGAVERRFLYIKPIVKREFQVQGTDCLNPEIHCDNFYDKWNFEVYSRIATSAKKSKKIWHLRGDDNSTIKDLEVFLISHFRKHIAHGEYLMNKRSETYLFEQKEPEVDLSVCEDNDLYCEPYRDLGPVSIIPEMHNPYTEAGQMSGTFCLWKLLVFALVSLHYLRDCFRYSASTVVSFWQCLVMDVYIHANYDVGSHIKVRVWVLLLTISFLLSLYYHCFGIYFCVVFFTVGSLNFAGIADTYIHQRVEENYGTFRANGMMALNSFRSLLSFVSGNLIHWAPASNSLLPIVALLVGCFAAFKVTESFDEEEEENKHSESSDFIRQDAVNIAMKAKEDLYECGKSHVRVNVNNTNTWNTMMCTPSKHTSDVQSLSRLIMRNVRSCKVIVPGDDSRTMITYCVGVQGNFALINLHAFGLADEVILRVSHTGGLRNCQEKYRDSRLRRSDCIVVATDIVLVALNQINFRDILAHFPIEDYKFEKADSIIGHTRIVSERYLDSMVVEDKYCGSIMYGPTVVYDWADHSDGDCGLPVVGSRDKGCCIVGIHSAGGSGPDAYALVVLRGDIQKAVSKMSSIISAPIFSEAAALYGKEPHVKSPIRYEDLGPIEYFGQVSQANINQKSSLERSIFYRTLDPFFKQHLGFVRGTIYAPPLMMPVMKKGIFVSPYNVAIRKMNKTKKTLIQGRVNMAIDIVVNKVFDNLSKRNIPTLNPLDVQTAVNGIYYDDFCRRLDMNKAAGFGTPGKKSNYAQRFLDHPGYEPTYDELDSIVVEELLRIISCYERGQNSGPVFKAQLKDEPRAIEKVISGKTRTFFATPFAFLVLQRMFLAPLYSLMLEFSEDFYTAIGIDMHRDANVLYDRITNFSVKVLEGDYGGYDCSMPFEIGAGANAVSLALLKKLGYSDSQLLITSGILSDLLFPTVEMIGEMMRVPGLQPSGKYGTAEDNSIRNLLIMVYMWLSIDECHHADFFENVLPVSYGDDVLAAVKETFAKYFNALTYSRLCETLTDMTFTTSDKGDVSEAFVDPSTMTFLKRNFVFHEVLNRVVAPLSLDSIYKTLEWISPSKTTNSATQMQMICSSSLRELFFHVDVHIYSAFRDYLLLGLGENYPLVSFVLPTFDDMRESLSVCSVAIAVPEGRQLPLRTRVSTESGSWNICKCGWDCTCEKVPDTTVYAFGRAHSVEQWPANRSLEMQNQVRLMREQYNESVATLNTMQDPMPGYSYRQVRQMHMYFSDHLFRVYADKYYALQNHCESLELSINRLQSWLLRSMSEVSTESGEEGQQNSGLVDEATIKVHENLTDMGGEPEDDEKYPTYERMAVGQKGNLDLNGFLARPITLLRATISPGSDFTAQIDLWAEYLNSPSVKAKLRNYAYLRANLNIRLAVSGTPFHFGKLLVSYQPLARYNKNLSFDFGDETTYRRQKITYFSQSPYAKVIDVKDNQPLEMTFPFISPQPMLRLFDKSSPLVLGAATPFPDSLGFGELFIYSLSPLGSASTEPTEVSVYLYAHLTDVELGAPTGTVIAVTTESGMMKKKKSKGKPDERKSGPLEIVASRASEIAYALTSIPAIAPFAHASGMTLAGIGNLAALFGFSVPTMNNEPARVKNEPFQNGAQLIGYDTGKRLTLDPKQELSIDPRVVCRDEDEMAIATICARESYMATFVWSTVDSALGTSIWAIPVNPRLSTSAPMGVGTRVRCPTALEFAATPFEYWRGDITYRFEIVCSKFHRGKLAFYFEPNVAQRSLIDAVLDLNKQYIKIIDIQETQDITFTVKWAFPRPWARLMLAAQTQDLGDSLEINYTLSEFANGYIGVVPFTQLQSPNDTGITVNVYTMSDNMMFNNFTSAHMPSSRPILSESGVWTESGRLSTQEITHMDLNDSSATMDYISEECFGEVPVSYRALMKRFASAQAVSTLEISGDSSDGSIEIVEIPMYPKILPDYNATTTSNKFSLYSYLRYAYIGIRGGMRHRITFRGDLEFGALNSLVVRANPPAEVLPSQYNVFSGSTSSTSPVMDGILRYVPATNGGIEFELPLYTNNLFGVSFNGEPFPLGTSLINPRLVRSFDVYMSYLRASSPIYAVHDFSTAEDFSLFGFQGAPYYLFDA